MHQEIAYNFKQVVLLNLRDQKIKERYCDN
jgi:hypothetical protein